MSRARDIADLSSVSARLDTVGGSEGALSNRNVIINGAMQVAQRGTSFTNPSVSAYTLDRWSTVYSHDGAVDVSQSTTAPAGFKNSLKIDVTTADSSLSSSQYYILQQPIEGQNLSHLNYGSSDAKEVTISFWVRSNKTGTYYVEIQTSGSQELARPYTINTANTWEHKTLTWIANTDFTITETNASGVVLYWWLAGGSAYTGSPLATTWANNTNRITGQTNFLDSTSNEFYLTGVQMEVGDTATDFEHRSFGDELLRCQRYYQETSNATNYSMVGDGTCQTSVVSILFDYLCEMRTSPSISALGTNGSSSWYIQSGSTTISTASSAFNGAWAAGTNSQRSWMDWTGISGQTASNTAAVYRNNQSTSNKNGCLAFDAEL